MVLEKRSRKKTHNGQTTKITTGCGNLYVTLNEDDDGSLIEVFARLGKSGGCPQCQLEGLTRCITIGIKYGVPMSEYTKQLENINCPSPNYDGGWHLKSCPDAIAHVLRRYSLEGFNNSPDKIPE